VRRRFSAERWLTVRHEDLCRDPEAELGKIFHFLGVAPGVRVQSFRAAGQHIIGNRMRLSTTSEIRLDESWKTELTPDQLRTVERIAGTELRRYRYESA
jgi:hypothetical protein